MARPRTMLPPSMLIAAALLTACHAGPRADAAGSVEPAPEPDGAAPAIPAETEPASDMSPRPVSRVVLGGGLVVEDLTVGEGVLCDGPASTITVRYQGRLASTGEVFDGTAPGQTADMPLGRLIRGWREGVPGMRVGGVRRLTIPSALAYGGRGLMQDGQVVIPPSEDLVFEIELLGVR